MSLNGNLEVFPLEEVLRLLARSRKTGCLRVESGGVQGRIFLNGGALTLATVAGDDELRRRLLASGLVTEADLRKVELSGSPVSESLAPDATPTALSEFVREESVEGLYRIRRSGRGSFDFLIDMNPRYPTGQSYDSEVIVSEADRRSLEWEDVESVLPSIDNTLRMVPVLDGEDAVTLSPSTWRILAALGSGASVSTIARVVGWSDFRSAREMASLYRNGLVTMVEPVGVGVAAAAAAVATAAVVPVGVEPALDSYAPAPEPVPVGEQPAAENPVVEAPVSGSSELEAPTIDIPAAAPTSDDVSSEVSNFETSSDDVTGSEDAASEWSIPTTEPVAPIEVQFDSFEEPAQAMTDAEADDIPVFEAPDWPSQTSPEVAVPEATDAASASDASASEAAASDASVDEVGGWWSDTASEPAYDPSPEVATEPAPQALDAPATPWNDSPWSAEIPTAEAPVEEPVVQSSPWGGWTSTPEVTEVTEPLEAADSVLESVDAAATEPDRTGGWWAETMGGAEAASERPATDNDADRFLESVFSSLSDENEAGPAKSEEEDDETGFGMGLLRRRRMGAAARDISDNNR